MWVQIQTFVISFPKQSLVKHFKALSSLCNMNVRKILPEASKNLFKKQNKVKKNAKTYIKTVLRILPNLLL